MRFPLRSSVIVFLAIHSAAFAQEKRIQVSSDPVLGRGARDCISKLIESNLSANHIEIESPFKITGVSISSHGFGQELSENTIGSSMWTHYEAEGKIKGDPRTMNVSGITLLRNYSSGKTSCLITGYEGSPSFFLVVRHGSQSSEYVYIGEYAKTSAEHGTTPFKHQFPFITDTQFLEKTGQNETAVNKTAVKDKIYAVMFTAKWCIYCPSVEKQLAELKAALGDRLEVSLLDWEQYGKSLSHTNRFLQASTPGVTFYKNGEPFAWLEGLDRNLLLEEWLLGEERIQSETPILTLTAQTFSEKTSVQDKWVVILISDGFHAYIKEQRESVREAQKTLKNQIVVYQMDSGRSLEGKDFYVNNGLFVADEENGQPGAVVVLMKNGKVVARLQNDNFKTNALDWINSSGQK